MAATQSGLHTITAPFDGIVARVPVTVGDMALPGTPLIALYDPSALRITAQLANAPAQALRQADEVQFVAQHRTALAPCGHASAGAAQRRSADPHGDGAGGLADRCRQACARPVCPPVGACHGPQRVPQSGAAPRLPVWIPAQAVVRRAEMTGVYVPAANGQPQLRQVRLGPVQGDQIEVLSGLRPGDQVALEPQKAAKGR